MLDTAIFWAFAVLSVGAALGAVLNRSIINAALCLIVVFMSIAGFYILNNADFLGIAQIIIYAVGLTILMLFAIMFTGDRPMSNHKVNRVARLAYGIVVSYVFALLLRGMLAGGGPVTPSMSPNMAAELAARGSTTMLGELLFSRYALPFELASILLLAAMIGAIVIAKKRFSETEKEEHDLLGTVRMSVDTASAPPEDVIAALRAQRLEGQSESPQTEIGGASETSSETAPEKKTTVSAAE